MSLTHTSFHHDYSHEKGFEPESVAKRPAFILLDKHRRAQLMEGLIGCIEPIEYDKGVSRFEVARTLGERAIGVAKKDRNYRRMTHENVVDNLGLAWGSESSDDVLGFAKRLLDSARQSTDYMKNTGIELGHIELTGTEISPAEASRAVNRLAGALTEGDATWANPEKPFIKSSYLDDETKETIQLRYKRQLCHLGNASIELFSRYVSTVLSAHPGEQISHEAAKMALPGALIDQSGPQLVEVQGSQTVVIPNSVVLVAKLDDSANR